MYFQQTCEASGNTTSSPALASGRTRFVPPAGAMIDLFGPVPALANLTARQAKDLGFLTSGTSGQLCATSSPSTLSGCVSKSFLFQQSLESKLRAKTQMLGSTLYKLTWKPWVTPSGRSRSRLRASALRTFATGPIGWPTPTTPSGGQKNPPGTTESGRRPNGTKATVTLGNVYMMRTGRILPPAFARSLMGLPHVWCDCAAMGTLSTLKRRESGSNQ